MKNEPLVLLSSFFHPLSDSAVFDANSSLHPVERSNTLSCKTEKSACQLTNVANEKRESIDEDEEDGDFEEDEEEPWLWDEHNDCLPGGSLSRTAKIFRLFHVCLWFVVCAVAVVGVAYSGYLIFGVWMPSVDAEFREQIITGEASQKLGHHLAMSYRPYVIHPYNDPLWLHPNSTHMLFDEVVQTAENYHGKEAAWVAVFFAVYSVCFLRCLLVFSPISFLYPYKKMKYY